MLDVATSQKPHDRLAATLAAEMDAVNQLIRERMDSLTDDIFALEQPTKHLR